MQGGVIRVKIKLLITSLKSVNDTLTQLTLTIVIITVVITFNEARDVWVTSYRVTIVLSKNMTEERILFMFLSVGNITGRKNAGERGNEM